MSSTPSSVSFHHLPTLIQNKILILLQSNNFTEAKQLYDKTLQSDFIKKPLSAIPQRNDAYYE